MYLKCILHSSTVHEIVFDRWIMQKEITQNSSLLFTKILRLFVPPQQLTVDRVTI